MYFMEYKEYLKKLGETALKYAELSDNENTVDLTPVPQEGISGDIEEKISFNGNGDWTFEYSKYCPVNISADGWIDGAPDGSVFDVYIDTNYPEHKSFKAVLQGQKLSTTIKTNTFSQTSLKIRIHSNKPNSTGTFHLHYSI